MVAIETKVSPRLIASSWLQWSIAAQVSFVCHQKPRGNQPSKLRHRFFLIVLVVCQSKYMKMSKTFLTKHRRIFKESRTDTKLKSKFIFQVLIKTRKFKCSPGQYAKSITLVERCKTQFSKLKFCTFKKLEFTTIYSRYQEITTSKSTRKNN